MDDVHYENVAEVITVKKGKSVHWHVALMEDKWQGDTLVRRSTIKQWAHFRNRDMAFKMQRFLEEMVRLNYQAEEFEDEQHLSRETQLPKVLKTMDTETFETLSDFMIADNTKATNSMLDNVKPTLEEPEDGTE